MKKYLLSFSSVCAMSIVLTAGTAHAQSMDYGSLQELFGEPVTTGATGTPQRASEVATNMTIITAADIKQSGLRSIPQIISRDVAGMDLLQTSNTSYDVGVRGYNQPFQPRLLVLLDGRQVFIDDYSRTIWDNIPVNIDDIRQIEVVKGAASALFGSNAAGGVVNIITYSPKYDNDRVVSINGGTQSRMGVDGTATVKYNDLAYAKFSAGGYNMNQTDGGFAPTEQPYRTAPRNRYFNGTTTVQATPNLEVNFEGTVSETRQNDASFGDNLDRDNPTSYSFRGGFLWQTPYGQIKSNNYLNHTNVDFDSSFGGHVSANTTLIVSQLEDQFKIGADHTFRAGLEYRHKEFRNSTQADIQPENMEVDSDVYAASATWLWNITDKLSWTNAARIDRDQMSQDGQLGAVSQLATPYPYYNQTQNAFTANSGLVYKLTDNDTFRLTYGRGAQLPSGVQTGYVETSPLPAGALGPTVPVPVGFLLIGNPDLKPSITTNYELGYDRKINQLDSVAKISTFYQLNQQIVGFVQANNTLPSAGGGTVLTVVDQAQNIGNSSAYGGELEFKGSNPQGFRWDGSYSFSRVTDNGGHYQGSAPQHDIRLNGGYSIANWDFDMSSQWQSSTDMSRALSLFAVSTPTSGYLTFGGRVGYNFNQNLTLGIAATNINRDVTNASPYPGVERQALVTLTGKF